jgi:hypothetical protein
MECLAYWVMAPVALAVHSRPIEMDLEFIVLFTTLLGIVGKQRAVGWPGFYVLKRLPAGVTSMTSLGIRPVYCDSRSALQFGERPDPVELIRMICNRHRVGDRFVGYYVRQHREVEAAMGQRVAPLRE